MGKKTPFFSIIIPTYQRPKQLKACLSSLCDLDYPPERFEVIVVNDGGEHPLDDIVTNFHERLSITLIRQDNAGPAAARNRGASEARGEFLAFTDDDCAPFSDWLQRLATRVGETPKAVIGGHTINGLPDNLYASASQQLIDYLYAYYNNNPKQARFLTSNNFMLPTKGFHELGGFDTSFSMAAGEDREFCDRCLFHGYQLIYAPDAQIRHAHHLSFRSFWQQHFNYGRAAFHFHRIRSRRGQGAVKMEPFVFYANLLRSPFSLPRGSRSTIITILLVVSQIANSTGYYRERVQFL